MFAHFFDSFTITLLPLAQIFALAAFGAILVWLRVIDRTTVDVLARLVTQVFLPLLISAHAQQLSPRQTYPGLFEAVQLGRVYADNKTFVDAQPKGNPAEIMRFAAENRLQIHVSAKNPISVPLK